MKKDTIKPSEFQCTVTSFKMLTPTVFELAFQTSHPLQFLAGQFISIIIPGAGPKGRDLRRAYSIASSPETYPIELCIKIFEDGPGTQYLSKLRPGDSFRGLAPYGDFVYKPKAGKNVCFISTGTGIAPFRAMLLSKYYQENRPLRTFSFLGVRTEDELLYPELMEQAPEVQFVNALSQPRGSLDGVKAAVKGRVTDYLKTINDEFPWLETEYYLCGHGSMITEVKAMLWEKGVMKEFIHQEVYYK